MLQDILDDQLDFNSGDFDSETITKINLLKIDANEQVKHIKEGRTALIVLSALTILAAIIGVAVDNEYATGSEIMLEGAILLAIYGTCAVFVKKNPRASLIIGLSIYLIVMLLSALIDPSSIISGIIIKGLIIFYLARAISSALGLKTSMQKLRKLGLSEKELRPLKDLEIITKTRRKKRADDIL